LVFSHNDLGTEHVLVEPATGAITGIDWSDAALTDPACDVGLDYRDLGPAALAAALAHYQPAELAGLRQRATFYARCKLLEDMAYGSRAGLSVYTDKSLAALPWVFLLLRPLARPVGGPHSAGLHLTCTARTPWFLGVLVLSGHGGNISVEGEVRLWSQRMPLTGGCTGEGARTGWPA
jgi:Phosphotransferase enzyme family